MRVAFLALWVCAGALIATILLSLAVRLLGAVRARREARYEQRTRSALAAFAAGAGDEPPPPRSALERRLFQRDLVALRPKLKGEAAESIGDLFVSYGLLEGARADLRSRSTVVQVRAADALGAIGATQAVADLVQLLSARNRLARLAAARALANLGATDAVPAILAALSDVGPHAEEVAEVFARFGAPVVPLLSERLRDPQASAHERRMAAAVLGDLRALSAADVLRGALHDPDSGVVAASARSLGRLGDVAAVAQLEEIVRGADDTGLRALAAETLGVIDDPSTASTLIEALGASQWAVRDAAARGLLELGDAGLYELSHRLASVPDRGVAHLAGVLDAADRLGPVIARAELGDEALRRFVQRACDAGVHARLRELATGDDRLGSFAHRILSDGGALAA